jgi:hypothetical protein
LTTTETIAGHNAEVDVAERALAVADILPRIEEILETGNQAAQRTLFREVEALARRRGFGAVVDGWEPDVAFLRGDPGAIGGSGRRPTGPRS